MTTDRGDIIKSIKGYLETDKLAGMEEIFIKMDNKAQLTDNKSQAHDSLTGLRGKAQDCKACKLHKKRTNLVFGSGAPNAKLMFVGEAPGADEDLKGEPFVGRAGQLLTKMIEAIGMKREGVYIANILKCRPPENRNPLPEEISACTHFLVEQIKSIKPKVICALGKFSAQFLLQTDEPISALRGKFYSLKAYGIDGVLLMPTFHPAYLLRNPNDKKLVWEDLKKIRDEIKK